MLEMDNKEIMENAEKKGNDSIENNGKDSKKDRKRFSRIKAYIKKHPCRILAVILLCIALFFVLRETGVISKHVHENVENMAEREGVSFDNLLLLYVITITDQNYHLGHRFLCVFNTGDVYCFENESWRSWDSIFFYFLDEDIYDDSVWEAAENVVYMGRLSNYDTNRLNEYVNNYDIYGEYYIRQNKEDDLAMGFEGPSNEERPVPGDLRTYAVNLYWHDQPEYDGRRDVEIETGGITFKGFNNYVKNDPFAKSYEENAMAALELIESTFFYDRFIYICHSLYPI